MEVLAIVCSAAGHKKSNQHAAKFRESTVGSSASDKDIKVSCGLAVFLLSALVIMFSNIIGAIENHPAYQFLI
jgi:hypothetical protein